MMLTRPLLAALALTMAPAVDSAPLPAVVRNASDAATVANVAEAIRRYRRDERVRMLHGSGQIPEVTMEFWKEITTGPDKGPTLIIAAAGGEGAPGSAASYISNFAQFGIEMTFLPIFGSNCPDLVDDPVILELVRDAHAIYFSGGMPGMLQGCLYGIDGRLEDGHTVPAGFSTPILDLILDKQVVGGDSAGLMAQPTGAYLTGTFPHDGATLIGGAYCPTGNMGLRSPQDPFIAHSHFSERGQQGPQLVAQWQEGERIGAGFDENLVGYYFEESGDVLMVADLADPTLRGTWIFELIDGSEEGQEGDVHMVISGEAWNARTNERIRNPAYTDCSGTGSLPPASDSIFSFSNNPLRSIALEVARSPVGSSLRNTDTGPAGDFVELVMTVTEQTVAFCDENGDVVGFEYLRFQQARLGKREPRPSKVHFKGW
jgi:hypothetical protein